MSAHERPPRAYPGQRPLAGERTSLEPAQARHFAARLAAAAAGGPVAEAAVIVEAWHADPALAEATAARMGELAARYAQRLAASGRASLGEADAGDARGFVWAPTRRGHPPSPHTLHLRRTALRAVYRTLRHLTDATGDPSAEVALPPKTTRTARPLDDGEIALLRTAALAAADPHRAAGAVALAEATATTGELARARWADLDLDAGLVALTGAPPVCARTGALTSWGTAALRRAHTSLAPAPSDPVVHRGASSPEGQRGQAAAANLLRRLLAAAGVAAADVRPTSVRLWAARHALDRGATIEQVARLLGLASLDAAADAIGYQWHHDQEPGS